MFIDGKLMRAQGILEKGLDVAMRRQDVIADNVANVDVPGFKKSEVIFESVLKRVLEENELKEGETFPLRTEHKRHLPLERMRDWRDVEGKQHIDYLTTMRQDGNNVDMEKEMTLAAQNQLRYNLMSQMVNHNFRQLSLVMRPI